MGIIGELFICILTIFTLAFLMIHWNVSNFTLKCKYGSYLNFFIYISCLFLDDFQLPLTFLFFFFLAGFIFAWFFSRVHSMGILGNIGVQKIFLSYKSVRYLLQYQEQIYRFIIFECYRIRLSRHTCIYDFRGSEFLVSTFLAG